ncbi:hypothetical protein [Microbulbifer thermotolerans]|uniref:Alginate export domain-containing protein n=1 Tax=Microbulbifer thermotolerans TaxID=252514 RepID=A0A143HJJ2_MICTH|nr:hypothetical protein [Microbulbifer thermotolerans]AMX01442.1 hypothetical protein A3224_01585 [Microbulbifer thermotolerans]MCX2778281.1 hypothetical protein [Microbulbifer thermotolerans]MCX2781996.1 hypothetical protein [Microbulbifer thermotolerans]MCX2783246.1 hypothetical protein [Microbulbifer thermotolerans]MCX2796298.1 hypothetical protein [Microbulbifer thermotolerans]
MRSQCTAVRLIPALLTAAICAAPSAADNDWAFDSSGGQKTWSSDYELTLQLIREREQLFAPLSTSWSGGDNTERSAAELRLDLQLRCNRKPCDGTRVVLKPRLALEDDERPQAMPDPHPDWLAEGYLLRELDGGSRIGAGKRLIGWGPSLLYSPTNRLFPDNGAVTPRRDIPGKPMLFASTTITSRGRANLLLADPRLDPVDGIESGGTFTLARAEWNWVESRIATLGAVAGGGGGFRPYIGGYFQHGLGEAWTIGIEASASRGYAETASGAEPLAQNRSRWRWDGVFNLRYGATSGAETGLELIYNGYAQSDKELLNPTLAALPSAGRGPSRNRPLHPFAQRHYALLQTTWPKLFGDRRWGLTARLLQGLDSASSSSFAELSYSPSDDATVYLGLSRSRAGKALEMSQPVTRSAYLALDAFF